MNIGRELISKVLRQGGWYSLEPLIEAGFGMKWLNDVNSGSIVIFSDIDRRAYAWMLKHWAKHHVSPSLEIFREHFSEEIFTLSNNDDVELDELLDLAVEKVNGYLLSEIIAKTIDLYDLGDVDRAVNFMRGEAAHLGTDLVFRKQRADSLGDPRFDLEEMLAKEIDPGIPFGIEPIDDALFGFQPGQLVTILGRQKAGKTTVTLNSALQAWQEGYDVLFFSVEMDVELLRQRLYSLGAHVSPSRFRRGSLRSSEKDKVRAFHQKMLDEPETSFYISKKKSLITIDDIREEAKLYKPHVIYIDGFNFMFDERTNKTAWDWQANENIAAELKTFALENSEGPLTIVVNAQVQEKQYHAKFGIEAKSIAGGTGLLKASDFVIGLDKTDTQHTISCTLSRFENFDNTVIEIDWDDMTIRVLEDE